MKLNNKFTQLLKLNERTVNIIDLIYFSLLMDITYTYLFENIGINKKLLIKKITKLKSKGLRISYNQKEKKYELLENKPQLFTFKVEKKLGSENGLNKYLVEIDNFIKVKLYTKYDLDVGLTYTHNILIEYKNGEFIGRID